MSYTASYIVNSSSAQGTTDFQFTFPYIKEEHIEVFLNYNKITQGSGSAQYQVITNVSPKLIRLNTGIASANLRVEVRRNSSLGSPLVDYADGSTLTANDLDTSALQSLYIDQELKDNQGKTVSVDEATGLPSMGESSAGNLRLTKVADPTAAQDAATKNYVDTKQFASAQIVDGTIVNADVNASAGIEGSKLQPSTGSNAGSMSAADKSKLDGIETAATADQTNAEIRAAVEAASDSNVFTDADHSKLNAIEASATADQTDAEIRTAVENATDSNVFTDADHTKLNAIEASATADQTDAEIRAAVEAASDSNVFTDADHTKLNAIEASATADQTATEIKTAYESNAQTNPLTDAEKAVIDGVTANTSELNKLDGVTASTAELNIVAGKSFKTSSGTLDTTSDTEIPSAKVIAAHVASSQTAIGGFVTIADEVSFPNTQPATGVVISINNAAGVVINGSGVSTTGRRLDSTTVTINGFPSSLNGETLAAGVGLVVTSTSTANTYAYHKLLAAETDVKQLSDDINDFNARYRVASSAPGSSNDAGDMYFDTSSNKMKVYNGTTNTWDDVASVGSFYVNTISSSSSAGGGSATFNGSAYRFTLSNAGTSAQQHIVSVNGVIQKPNSGTSQPSEGFALSGNDIIFSAAPASGSDSFIITCGSSVSIGTPSANSVNSSHIIDGSIVDGDISNSANIAGSKVADDSIPEVKLDVHNAPATDKYLKYTSNGMEWSDGASEGTDVKSTGESSATKFLRTDGDGTSSWQDVPSDNTKANINGQEFTGVVGLKGSSEQLKFYDADISNYVHVKSPTALTGNTTYTLPVDDGSSGQLLKTSGSGALSWTDPPASSPQFEATASGAITAGKPVIINSNGTVTQIAESFAALTTPVLRTAQTIHNNREMLDTARAAYDKTNNRVLITYKTHYPSNELRYYAGTPTATGVDWGYGSHFGSEQQGDMYGVVFDDNVNKFIVFGKDGDGVFCRTITLTGTTQSSEVTIGTRKDFDSHTGGTNSMAGTNICWDSTANKAIIAYRDNSDSYKIKACTVTAASDGTITFGTVATITASDHHVNPRMAHVPGDGKTMMVYKQNWSGNYKTKSKVLTVSGTTISASSEANIDNAGGEAFSLILDENSGRVVFKYLKSDSGDKMGVRVGSITSGGNPSWGSFVQLFDQNTIVYDKDTLLYDPVMKQIIVIDRNRDPSSTYYGRWWKGTVSTSSNTFTVTGTSTGYFWGHGSTTSTSADTSIDVFPLTCFYDTTYNQAHIIYRNENDGDDGYSITLSLHETTTNLTDSNFIGLAAATVADTATATVDVTGATNTGVSGLTVGSNYYVQGSGLLSTSGTRFAGKAIAANKLIVDYQKPSSPAAFDIWSVTSDSSNETWDDHVIGSGSPTAVSIARQTVGQNPLFEKIGTGMTYSSGIWAFPSTGFWEVIFRPIVYVSAEGIKQKFKMELTQDNGTSWNEIARTHTGGGHQFEEPNATLFNLLNISNISNQKIRFLWESEDNCKLQGASGQLESHWVFKKIY